MQGASVFDRFRQSLEDLLNDVTPPEERRAVVSRMRDTLVRAKSGLYELRNGVERARAQLAVEERDLETVRRRKQLAEGIQDRETVEIATRYERVHEERVTIVRQKVVAQEAELALAEREVETMTAELKKVAAGEEPARAGGGSIESSLDDELDGVNSRASEEIDAMGRARARADREADAERRLEELKRRMGK